jgi:hypothetical protein
VLVGTHALISEDVQFARLGLVVTDEQHRFGVEQRSALTSKGDRPHVLVMSATPYPPDPGADDLTAIWTSPFSTSCLPADRRWRRSPSPRNTAPP